MVLVGVPVRVCWRYYLLHGVARHRSAVGREPIAQSPQTRSGAVELSQPDPGRVDSSWPRCSRLRGRYDPPPKSVLHSPGTSGDVPPALEWFALAPADQSITERR